MAKKKVTAAEGEQNRPVATVISEFRDINNFDKVYEVGDDVSHLDDERLDTLVEKGLVEYEQTEETPPAA